MKSVNNSTVVDISAICHRNFLKQTRTRLQK